MKKSQFSTTQIANMLKEVDNGKTAEQINREHGVSKASLYKWRQRYGGMEAGELNQLYIFNLASHQAFTFSEYH